MALSDLWTCKFTSWVDMRKEGWLEEAPELGLRKACWVGEGASKDAMQTPAHAWGTPHTEPEEGLSAEGEGQEVMQGMHAEVKLVPFE